MVKILNAFQRIPFWLPPVLAVAIMCLYYVLAGGSEFAGRTFLMLFLLVVFIAMAVITPFPLFLKRNTGLSYGIPLFLASFCALALFGLFMLGGSRETRVGGLLPPFEYRFPISGWIIDNIVTLTGLGDLAYHSPGYNLIIWTGLFIEIAVVSAIICLILAHFSSEKTAAG
jgi:hypothetical protein